MKIQNLLLKATWLGLALNISTALANPQYMRYAAKRLNDLAKKEGFIVTFDHLAGLSQVIASLELTEGTYIDEINGLFYLVDFYGHPKSSLTDSYNRALVSLEVLRNRGLLPFSAQDYLHLRRAHSIFKVHSTGDNQKLARHWRAYLAFTTFARLHKRNDLIDLYAFFEKKIEDLFALIGTPKFSLSLDFKLESFLTLLKDICPIGNSSSGRVQSRKLIELAYLNMEQRIAGLAHATGKIEATNAIAVVKLQINTLGQSIKELVITHPDQRSIGNLTKFMQRETQFWGILTNFLASSSEWSHLSQAELFSMAKSLTDGVLSKSISLSDLEFDRRLSLYQQAFRYLKETNKNTCDFDAHYFAMEVFYSGYGVTKLKWRHPIKFNRLKRMIKMLRPVESSSQLPDIRRLSSIWNEAFGPTFTLHQVGQSCPGNLSDMAAISRAATP